LVSRSVIGMVAVVVIIAAAGAYYMASRPSTPLTTTQPAKPITTSSSADGAKLYKDNCLPCHGAKGAGGSAGALTVSNVNRAAIENGNVDKGMPRFGDKLSADEISAIIEFLSS
jgi:mono/diheme cytochrome c family protein